MNHRVYAVELPCPYLIVDAEVSRRDLRVIAGIQAQQSQLNVVIRKVPAKFRADAARGAGDE
jgi:hypothetical protein